MDRVSWRGGVQPSLSLSLSLSLAMLCAGSLIGVIEAAMNEPDTVAAVKTVVGRRVVQYEESSLAAELKAAVELDEKALAKARVAP